ncbi:MAG: hypothetical protein HS126_37400 [Anaerolineales bacterium]|nr:hypothetical protein [Anaerolineales bacterium]
MAPWCRPARPPPNSPVFSLNQEETVEKLQLIGDVILGLAVGYEEMPVALPTTRKDVFPRHVEFSVPRVAVNLQPFLD